MNEKIYLRNATLVNWYGFIQETLSFSKGMTFITGENKNGKSTALDAIRYALFGDSSFNRSSGAKQRTLSSYTRCLLDGTLMIYARPADRFPTVTTHIALEFYDELEERSFVLGTIIETASDNSHETRRYFMDNTKVEDIEFLCSEDDVVRAYTTSEFKNLYRVEVYSANDGLEMFSRKIGLSLNKTALKNHQRSLRSLMSYEANTRVAEFMKSYVLEPQPVDMTKLKNNKQYIDSIRDDLANIEQELSKLKEILDEYHNYDIVKTRVIQDRVRELIINKKEDELTKDSSKKESERLSIEIRNCEQLLEENKEKSKKANDDLADAKARLQLSDAGRAVENEKKKLTGMLAKEPAINQKAETLSSFQKIINSILEKYPSCVPSETETILKNLEPNTYSSAEKESAVNTLKSWLSNKRDECVARISIITSNISENNNQISEIDASIINLKKGLVDYSRLKKQRILIEAINKEFNRRNIRVEARMAFEFVLKVNDPEWQEAIETFLGKHRYAVIVSPEYFQIANTCLDSLSKSTDLFGVELVRTPALMSRNFDIVDDSALNKLEIEDETAKRYFAFWLGKIHAVDLSEVDKYDSALSKEGKLSRSLSVSYMNLSKLKEYSLGINSFEKTISIREKEKESLIGTNKTLVEERTQFAETKKLYEGFLSVFREYDYAAVVNKLDFLQEKRQTQDRIAELEESLKTNSEYLILVQEVKRYQDICTALTEEQNSLNGKKNSFEWNLKLANKRHSEANARIEENTQKIDDIIKEEPSAEFIVDELFKETADSLRSKTRTVETRNRDARALNNSPIPALQRQYNLTKRKEDQIEIGIEFRAEYQARYNKIEMKDFKSVQNKLNEQMNYFKKTFKNDFCSRIYTLVNNSLLNVNDINRELRNLQFSTQYHLDISKLNDDSSYAKILKFGEYLDKTSSQADLPTIFSFTEYEDEELKYMEDEVVKVIETVLADGNNDEMVKLSDYRNYLSYEVIVNGDGVTNGKLSRQIGYESGAGTQIPYLLILASSLSMLFRRRSYCNRLAFIDEPFEKMSDSNISTMLNFFKQQDFQLILCAPTNRMGSIGKMCDCQIPVKRIRPDKMIAGKAIWKAENH